MSGSFRRPVGSHTRHSGSIDLAVTEANFQSLDLGTGGESHQYTVPLSYPDPATSYARSVGVDPTNTYLGYPNEYTATPLSNPTPPRFEEPQGPSRSSQYHHHRAPSPSQIGPVADMSNYGFLQSPLPTNSQSYNHSSVYFPGHQTPRSMSHPFGPSPFIFDLPLDFPGPAEPEMTRQRRRALQDSRRHSKVRLRRRANVPSILGSGPESPFTSSSVDFSFVAPSESSTYVSDPNRSNRRSDVPPARENYGIGSGSSYPLCQLPSYPTIPASVLAQPSLPAPPYSQPPPPRAIADNHRREKPQCWEHGCNGREFSTFSNLLRHQREKSGNAAKSYCPHCGAEFTRTTARNGHIEQGKCKPRRTSND